MERLGLTYRFQRVNNSLFTRSLSHFRFCFLTFVTIATLSMPAYATVLDIPVSSTNDDAEETLATGSVYLNSDDLEMVDNAGDLQAVGVRFAGMTIPVGAVISNAYIQFQADEVDSGTATLVVRGEATDNAQAYTGTNSEITNRPTTTASVTWYPLDWNATGDVGIEQQTPDLTAVIQEIIDRSGWTSGNALALIVTGSGKRVAESYDGGAAPILHVEYSDNNTAPTLNITSPTDGTTKTQGTNITFSGTANDNEDGNLSSSIQWASDINGAIGTGASINISSLSVNTHTITANVTDSGGLVGTSSISLSVSANGGTIILDTPISATNDDAEETVATGSVYLTSDDLEMVNNTGELQAVGVRFAGMTIPVGAVISNAYIQFQADEVDTGTAALVVRGEATDNALAFSGTNNDITNRPTTTASVSWYPLDWNAIGDVGIEQRTPDLTTVVQEIVNRSGWLSGNALALIVTGSGKRVAETYDGTTAPVLHLEYSTGGGSNTTPTVGINSPSNGTSVTQGTNINFTGSANDTEDGDLGSSIQWSSDQDGLLGTGASINISTLSVNTHTITASVTDSGSLNSSDTISVTVTSSGGGSNTTPTVSISSPTNGTSVTQGTSIAFTGTANDTEDGDLGGSIQWSSDIDGVIGSGASINTNSLSVNTHTITASVTDSGGATGQSTVSITIVTNQNQAPVITSSPNTAAFLNNLYSDTVIASDPDGDAISFSLTTAPTGMSIDANTGMINWTPTNLGDYDVVVNVTDGQTSAAQSYTINVPNQLPFITTPALTVAYLGVLYQYQPLLYEPDGDAVTYSLITAPTGMTIDSVTGLVDWLPGSLGQFSVEISVMDSRGGSDLQAYTLTVFDPIVDYPPQILSAPVTEGLEGDAYEYRVNAIDVNGDTLTYSLNASPTNVIIDSITGVIQWVSPVVGNYPIDVQVADGAGQTDTQSYTLSVLSLAEVDILIQAKWDDLWQDLVIGDKTSAMTQMTEAAQEKYGPVFDALLADMTDILPSFSEPQLIEISGNTAEYILRNDLNGDITYHFIYFRRDNNGVWQIESM